MSAELRRQWTNLLFPALQKHIALPSWYCQQSRTVSWSSKPLLVEVGDRIWFTHWGSVGGTKQDTDFNPLFVETGSTTLLCPQVWTYWGPAIKEPPLPLRRKFIKILQKQPIYHKTTNPYTLHIYPLCSPLHINRGEWRAGLPTPYGSKKPGRRPCETALHWAVTSCASNT